MADPTTVYYFKNLLNKTKNSGFKTCSKTRVWVFDGKCCAWAAAAKLMTG